MVPFGFGTLPSGITVPPAPVSSAIPKIWDDSFNPADPSNYTFEGAGALAGGEFQVGASGEGRLRLDTSAIPTTYNALIQAEFLAPSTAPSNPTADVWVAGTQGALRAQLNNQQAIQCYNRAGGGASGQISFCDIQKDLSFWIRLVTFMGVNAAYFWGNTTATETPPDQTYAYPTWSFVNGQEWVTGQIDGFPLSSLSPEVRINNSDATGEIVCQRLQIWSLDNLNP